MGAAPVAWAAATVYAGNFGAGTVSAFSVGLGGALTQISGSPFSTGSGSEPWGMAISPDARDLFVARSCSCDEDVAVFSIGADGGLSQISGSPYPAGNSPLPVALTPDGSYLYVTNYDDGTVSAYSVAADGALTPVTGSPFSAGTQPIAVAVSPDGRYVYVGNYSNGTSGSVSAYSIGAHGGLTQLGGSPFPAGKGPEALIVTPDGKHLYSANANSTRVSAFSIGAGGSLSKVSGSPFPAGDGPIALAVTPDGKHLYAANIHSHNVSAYSIGADGSLTEVTGSPFPAGSTPEWAAVTPDGKHLYVTTFNGVSAYTIHTDGGLSAVAGSPFAADGNTEGLAITPDQRPVASFMATVGLAGRSSTFNASASKVSAGQAAASYAWSFGDGSHATSKTPTVNHAFEKPGTYMVALTVTDNAGCSTARVFTGQMDLCNGGPAARTTRKIVVKAPSPNTTITSTHIGRAKRKATFDFTGSGGDSALHFECKLDSESWNTCSSPKTYTGLARGSHTFEVRAIDSRGEVDPTPAKRTFKI